MNKKFRFISLILCLALLGSGCSSAAGSKNNVSSNDTRAEDPYQAQLSLLDPQDYSNVNGLSLEKGSTISMIGRSAKDSYWKAVEAGAKQAVADLNSLLGYKGDDKIKLNFSAPSAKDDIDDQVNLLDEELSRYPVAIAIAPVDATACEVQFESANDNGIPVVTFDSGTNFQDVDAHVSTANAEASSFAAQKLSELMDGKGQVAVFVQDSLSLSSKELENGFVTALSENYPEISPVSFYHMDKLTDMAASIAAEQNENLQEGEEGVDPDSITQEDVVKYILEKNPDLTGIYTTSSEATELVASVLTAEEKEDLAFVGIEDGDSQLKLLSDGVVDGLILQNPYAMGYAAIVSAVRAVGVLGNQAFVDSGFTWVTKDNMEDADIKKMFY